jgi:hypothetical protein
MKDAKKTNVNPGAKIFQAEEKNVNTTAKVRIQLTESYIPVSC